jgi:hypothetical protein
MTGRARLTHVGVPCDEIGGGKSIGLASHFTACRPIAEEGAQRQQAETIEEAQESPVGLDGGRSRAIAGRRAV